MCLWFAFKERVVDEAFKGKKEMLVEKQSHRFRRFSEERHDVCHDRVEACVTSTHDVTYIHSSTPLVPTEAQ